MDGQPPVAARFADAVLDALPVGVVVVSRAEGLRHANPCALRLLGFDALGSEDWVRTELASAIARLGLPALDGGASVWTGSVQVAGAAGPVDLEVRVQGVDSEHVVVALEPVAPAVQAEDNARVLAAVVHQTSDFVSWHGPIGAEARINPAAAALIGGQAAPDRPLPHAIRELFEPESFEVLDTVGARSMYETGQWRGPVKLRNRDTGEIRDIDFSMFIVRVDDRVIGTAGIGRDVTDERAATERALQWQMLRAQEEERRRIAADVHDDSAQAIFAVGLRLQMLQNRLEGEDRILVDEALSTADEALHRLRRLIFDLHPGALDGNGLIAALTQVAETAFADSTTKFTVEGDDGLHLAAPLRAAVFRAAREAVLNAARHARAHIVEVVVTRVDGGLGVRVRDDGVGFDPEEVESKPGHLGLRSLEALVRATNGRLQVCSAPGDGSTVEVWVPAATEA